MGQRIITAAVALAVLFTVLFVLPPVAAKIVMALLLLGGAWEWSGFLDAPGRPTRFVYVGVVAAGLAAAALLPEGLRTLLLEVALVWWLAAFVWTFFFPTPIPLPVRWIVGLLVLVPMYSALTVLYDIGPMLLLFTLLVVWVADSGAYFAGKRFGRVKLAPRISPGKTWEGVIGGLVAVALLTIGRSFVIDSNLAVLLPFCLAAAGISIVGDLTVSMFKRTAGVKDSGRLFPGHGGILDRVDSVSAAAPLFAIGVSVSGLR